MKQKTLEVINRISSSPPMSAQAAVVRALAEETDRHHPAETCVPELHNQLSEELERLASIAKGPPSEPAPIDVLVVDDDEASRRVALRIVESFGYPCRAVCDGKEALEAYAKQPAAIVLSDWSMPGMSGLELCLALKAYADPPYVILATAFHENGKLLDGVRHGVDDFLRKPLVLEELEVRLLAASRLVRAARAIRALVAET